MPYDIKDIALAEAGETKIEWASKWMKVVNGLYEKFKNDKTFKDKRIVICIHLEAKTAYLATIFQKLGAEVWITSSNPLSAKDDVCAALAKKGINVYAKYGANEAEYTEFIKILASAKPHAIVDDGGDICELLHVNHKYGENLKGICEETTSGVVRLKELDKQGKLKYPAIGINDAKSKYLFDNRYGTGQSTWTAISHITNLSVANKSVVVIGYGWVGRGVADVAKGLGANVVVTELDPWKAMEAGMDGHRVMPLLEAAPIGDFFITTTGMPNVLREEHFLKMKDSAFLANAGHFNFEIDVPKLNEIASDIKIVRDEIEQYTINKNKKIYLLAKGGIINIAGGLGHPVEILDLSFGLQLASMHYILSQNNLQPKYYDVPEEIDKMVVSERLKVDNISIDS